MVRRIGRVTSAAGSDSEKMNRMKTMLHGIARWLALGLVTLSLAAAGEKSEKPEGASGQDDLFAQPKVWRLKIELPPAAQEALRKDPKTYVKATLREGTVTLADVGVRLKGNGSFQGLDQKPSLAIKFHEFTPGQKFHGVSKVLLNNSRQDPTCLCEALGGEVFRAAGVPAARVTFARVELNGRDAGLYTLVEAANRDFLSQHFKKSKGNLYEGSNNDVTDKLDKDSGDAATEQTDLKALATATKEPDPAQRWRKLAALLDVERFISFAAAEVITWHHDGYTMDRNNYRIYHDPASDQMVFLPHGLDQLFGKADGPLIPDWKGLVAKSVLSTPTGQARYLEKMSSLLNTVFKADALQARVNELSAMIRPSLAETSSGQTKAFDDAVTKLREHIARRATFIGQQLKALPPAK